MYSVIRSFVVLCAFLVTAIAHAQCDRLFVLGDSLSDNGNLNSTGQVPFLAGPPYDDGRFSNGPVAVELLAESLGINLQPSLHLLSPQFFVGGTNYAVAGAKAGGTELIDLGTQLAALQAFNPAGFTSPDCFVFMYGGNDIRGAGDLTTRQAIRSLFDAAKAIETAVETVIASGAENIIIVNAPDIGKIPETQLLAAGDPNLPKKLTFRSRIFNFFLNRSVRSLKRENDAHIVQFDLFRFFTYLTRNGEDLGYENSEDACFVQVGASQIYHPDCDFDEFLFFDAIHPTAITHARAASALKAIVPDTD